MITTCTQVVFCTPATLPHQLTRFCPLPSPSYRSHPGQPPSPLSPTFLLLLSCTAVLPPLHQGNPWLLLYSTARDGISLATLMRKAEKVGVMDSGRDGARVYAVGA